MTSYPRKTVSYPLITVKGTVDGDQKLGQSSEAALVSISLEVRVWARNEKEKNNIYDEVYNYLRTNQYPTSTADTNTNVQLFDFTLNNSTDVDEDGEESPKSKVATFKYIFIAT